MISRGDIITVRFPYSDGSGSKVRPSLVIQNDADNQRLQNTIVAMITGNTTHANEPTQMLVDPSTTEGASSGLVGLSVVKCSVLTTVDQRTVLRTLGHLPSSLLEKVDNCLRAALGLS